MADVYWRRVARGWQLKFRLETGNVKRFDGFREDDKKSIYDFLSGELGKTLETQVIIKIYEAIILINIFH